MKNTYTNIIFLSLIGAINIFLPFIDSVYFDDFINLVGANNSPLATIAGSLLLFRALYSDALLIMIFAIFMYQYSKVQNIKLRDNWVKLSKILGIGLLVIALLAFAGNFTPISFNFSDVLIVVALSSIVNTWILLKKLTSEKATDLIV